MDYLRDIFNEEINAEGNVVIATQCFDRHYILYELASDVYDLAFSEWVNMRQEGLIAKADEIVNKHDNEGRFKQLKIGITTRNIIPFVGAGLSVPSGYPTWTQFLYNLCEESHVTNQEIEALLGQGLYEEAAQKLYDDLGPELFNENIEVIFGNEKRILGPINYLPLVFPESSIITSNFDNILERVFQETSDHGLDTIQHGSNLNEILRIISNGTRALIKIHGDSRYVANRVLTKEEYDTSYSEESVVRDFFYRLLFSKSLLFIGCSLVNDRTIKTMREIVEQFGAITLPRHFAFLESKNSEDRVTRKKELAKANIFPIWYPENDHDESLEGLFLKLLEE